MKEKTVEVKCEAKDPDPDRKIEVGDLVNLRSQPYILMTVEFIHVDDDRDIHCVWLTSKMKVRRDKFPSFVLRIR